MKVKEINRNYTTVWGGAFPAKTGAANRDAYPKPTHGRFLSRFQRAKKRFTLCKSRANR
jgi:hypothetical protein